jgi:Ethanolamine utilization protein EutJ (predicted chaperonin)
MKLVIGLLIGIFVVFLLGAVSRVDVGGTGTYQTQMSYDGKRIAVMDTRTGTVKIFNVCAGDKILSFTEDERTIKERRFSSDFEMINQ